MAVCAGVFGVGPRRRGTAIRWDGALGVTWSDGGDSVVVRTGQFRIRRPDRNAFLRVEVAVGRWRLPVELNCIRKGGGVSATGSCAGIVGCHDLTRTQRAWNTVAKGRHWSCMSIRVSLQRRGGSAGPLAGWIWVIGDTRGCWSQRA